MPAPKRRSSPGPAVVRLKSPRLLDAYTREPIRYVKAGEFWIASTSLWTSRPFHFKADAEYAFSHVDGRAPDYPKPGAEVVRDVNEPPRSGDEE